MNKAILLYSYLLFFSQSLLSSDNLKLLPITLYNNLEEKKVVKKYALSASIFSSMSLLNQFSQINDNDDGEQDEIPLSEENVSVRAFDALIDFVLNNKTERTVQKSIKHYISCFYTKEHQVLSSVDLARSAGYLGVAIHDVNIHTEVTSFIEKELLSAEYDYSSIIPTVESNQIILNVSKELFLNQIVLPFKLIEHFEGKNAFFKDAKTLMVSTGDDKKNLIVDTFTGHRELVENNTVKPTLEIKHLTDKKIMICNNETKKRLVAPGFLYELNNDKTLLFVTAHNFESNSLPNESIVIVYDTLTLTEKNRFKGFCYYWSPAKNFFIVFRDDKYFLYDAADGLLKMNLDDGIAVDSVQFDKTERYFFYPHTNKLDLIDLENDRLIEHFENVYLSCIDLVHDRFIVHGINGDITTIRSIRNGKVIAELIGRPLKYSFSKDGKFIMTRIIEDTQAIPKNYNIALYDAYSFKKIDELAEVDGMVEGLSSESKKYFVFYSSCKNKTLHTFWDKQKQKIVACLSVKEAGPVQFSPNEEFVVFPRKVKVFETTMWKNVINFIGDSSIIFNADSSLMMHNYKNHSCCVLWETSALTKELLSKHSTFLGAYRLMRDFKLKQKIKNNSFDFKELENDFERTIGIQLKDDDGVVQTYTA